MRHIPPNVSLYPGGEVGRLVDTDTGNDGREVSSKDDDGLADS